MNETRPILDLYIEYLARTAEAENHIEWQGYKSILRKIKAMIKAGIQWATLAQVFKYEI